MTEPFVSVIVSSCNRPRLIRDAVDSVLAQTWRQIQILIADDWSDVRTLAILEGFADAIAERCPAQVNAVSYVQPGSGPPTNDERRWRQRVSVCINAAMPYVRGEFVCFLPDDDFLTPRSIEVRARYLIEHPEANCLYGRLESCQSLYGLPVFGLHFCADDWSGLHHFLDCGQAVPVRADPMEPAASNRFPVVCAHGCRDSFWSAEPIARAANKVDHGMMMVRRVPALPHWPEVRTGVRRISPPLEGRNGRPNALWAEIDDQDLADEWFDCPDAGWFFRLELAGLGPFHSVPEVVVVKRYHQHGHRTDPAVRE